MRLQRPKLVTVLGSAIAVLALAFCAPFFAGMQLSAWQSSPSPAVMNVASATMPAPTSASGKLTSSSSSSTSTSTYAAIASTTYSTVYGTWNILGCATLECSFQCSVTGQVVNTFATPPAGAPSPSSPCETTSSSTSYSCPYGGYLSGTICYVTTSTTTTTNTVKFTWSETYTGQFLVPNIQIVEATSCTSSSWTPIATATDSTGSYTVNSPSSSEYYAIRTVNHAWIGPVTSCTQG
jgi:hypothetical protein